MMSGKELFSNIINEAFKVLDTEGNALTGLKKNTAIARKLLSLPLNRQPRDFQDLVALMKLRAT